MNKHDHIIVINGRHYNAKTGENLSHSDEPVRATAAPKAARPTTPQPAAHKPARNTSRQAAGHVTAHSPKPARTLMRQAVKRPPAGLKRRIRVQGHLDTQIKPPIAKAPAAHSHARQIRHHAPKGGLISHFSPNLFTTVTVITAQPVKQSLISSQPIANHDVTPRPTMRPAFAPKKPRTTADLLEYAIQYADNPLEREEPIRGRHSRKLARRGAYAAAH